MVNFLFLPILGTKPNTAFKSLRILQAVNKKPKISSRRKFSCLTFVWLLFDNSLLCFSSFFFFVSLFFCYYNNFFNLPPYFIYTNYLQWTPLTRIAKGNWNYFKNKILDNEKVPKSFCLSPFRKLQLSGKLSKAEMKCVNSEIIKAFCKRS